MLERLNWLLSLLYDFDDAASRSWMHFGLVTKQQFLTSRENMTAMVRFSVPKDMFPLFTQLQTLIPHNRLRVLGSRTMEADLDK